MKNKRCSQATCKPSSGCHTEARHGGHLSRTTVTRRLKRPTRERREARHRSPIWSCSGRGLPSRPVTRPLVRSYRTISPLPANSEKPAGGLFLLRFPWGCPLWELPSALPQWSSDFPRPLPKEEPRPPGRLTARPAYPAPQPTRSPLAARRRSHQSVTPSPTTGRPAPHSPAHPPDGSPRAARAGSPPHPVVPTTPAT